jgi:hypothetical protein
MGAIPRFDLGQTVITRRALRALRPEEVIAALGRHVLGDWGEVGPPVSRANELAVETDGPVVSAFVSQAAGTHFYVVTAADRSQTTVCLAGERADG